jgi:hypothetical protein
MVSRGGGEEEKDNPISPTFMIYLIKNDKILTRKYHGVCCRDTDRER